MEARGLLIELRGTVQGVGFRPWLYRVARRLGLEGEVHNGASGVSIEAHGDREALEALRAALRDELPSAARISHLRSQPIAPRRFGGFFIRESEAVGARRASIPADLATCEACLAEVLDPTARRHRYAFTNCTACGPRFTICRAVPYDRARTSMDAFPMCPDCRREYLDPADRRFHAEPIACPACGPRLALLDLDGRARPAGDPLREAARLLSLGQIVAIKSLGGYQLACDATNEAAVRELRRRKRRDFKPFALMLRDLDDAERLLVLDAPSRALLRSQARPIVLAARRDRSLPDELAPGSELLGAMLPYTPLHHLLMAELRRPLVMTSGNLSEEPIVFEDEAVIAALGPIADAILTHDRPIVTRCDDSVARVVAGRSLLVRRSRGYVPEPIGLGSSCPEPVLAVGGQLKNTFCIALEDQAYLGPHVGDLDNAASYEGLVTAIERLESFLGVHPRLVAHDAHPDYASTRYALSREGRRCAVQHHHAHVAAVIAEHRLDGPVLGLAYDGSGLGPDGSAWGGELLLSSLAGYERLATLRPIALAGGDRAVHQVWRLALAALDDAFDGAPPLERLRLFDAVGEVERAGVRRMIARGVHTFPAHGAGRWFDAVAALLFARDHARYEGELAMALEQAAGAQAAEPYPFEIDRARPLWSVDLRPTLRAIVAELIDAAPRERVAARFHETLVHASAELVSARAADAGAGAVVLAGGCFQNARLGRGLIDALADVLPVFLPERAPAGDGGLALGQAAIAARSPS